MNNPKDTLVSNELSIIRFFDLEHMATDPRDGRSDHDVTTALTHSHWATLSRFYAEHPAAFHAEADRSWGPRAERLREKIASLS